MTVFNDETTIDVDVDTLGKDAVWQEEKLEFEDVEEPGEDKAEQVQGRLEELWIKKLTSFFAHVANGDSNNSDSNNEDNIFKQRT